MSSERLSEWIALAVQGEEAACAAIYHHFSPSVLRFALGLLNDLDDAEEVVQDTFVYALRHLRRFDATKSVLSTWLFTIALSRCRNKRRRKRLVTLPFDFLAAEERTPANRVVEMILERRGVRRQVWEALQRLPPRLREPVALRFLAGLRYQEIGQALGCGPKTAESRVRLGLNAMRRTLRAWGVEPEVEWGEQWV